MKKLLFLIAFVPAFALAYVYVPSTGSGGANLTQAPVVLGGSNVTLPESASSTTWISGLDVTCPVNKTCKIKYTIAFISGPSATAYVRVYHNFPTDMVAFVSGVPVFNAGATPTTLTPSDDSNTVGIGAQLQADDIYLSEWSETITMGATPGALEFGLRNVAAGDMTLIASMSFYELQVLP